MCSHYRVSETGWLNIINKVIASVWSALAVINQVFMKNTAERDRQASTWLHQSYRSCFKASSNSVTFTLRLSASEQASWSVSSVAHFFHFRSSASFSMKFSASFLALCHNEIDNKSFKFFIHVNEIKRACAHIRKGTIDMVVISLTLQTCNSDPDSASSILDLTPLTHPMTKDLWFLKTVYWYNIVGYTVFVP